MQTANQRVWRAFALCGVTGVCERLAPLGVNFHSRDCPERRRLSVCRLGPPTLHATETEALATGGFATSRYERGFKGRISGGVVALDLGLRIDGLGFKVSGLL